ncbi:MAG: enoyl-CoA hydratase-related protein [Chloroflexota bacterium]
MATITLNRPEVLNAFDTELRSNLTSAFAQVKADEAVRAVVLTGAGRGFCAGQDLQTLMAAYQGGTAPLLGEDLRQEYNPLILAMRHLPKPIVGAINGVAAGAGCSLALACDLRVSSDQASYLQAFVKVGLVPDSGSSFFLPHLVGMARAAEMMFLGEPVRAADAERVGLVNRVVPPEQLMPVAREIALRLAQLPTTAIGQAKRQLNLGLHEGLEAVLEEEAKGQNRASQTHDHLEGIHAFLEKRLPRFSGK